MQRLCQVSFIKLSRVVTEGNSFETTWATDDGLPMILKKLTLSTICSGELKRQHAMKAKRFENKLANADVDNFDITPLNNVML